MKNIFYIISLAFLFTACERIVEVEIPSNDPKLVIEGELTSINEPWKVRLTLSQPYFDQATVDAITSAVVTVSGSDGSNISLSHTDTGMFVSPTSQSCVIGVTYTLNVLYNGKNYMATEKLENAFPIDTIASYFLPEANGFIASGTYVFIQGKENTYDGDRYLFKMFINDTLFDGFGSQLDSDEFGQVSYLNQSVDVNDLLGGIARGITPRPFPTTVEKGDTVRIEQYAISKQYYQFIIDREAQQNRGGTPFDPPPANPNNNVSNGALGYFSVVHKEMAGIRIL